MVVTKKIVVERTTKKALQDQAIKAQLQKLASQSLKSNRGNGWTFECPTRIAEPVEDSTNGNKIYTCTVKFTTTANRQSIIDKWPGICRRFAESSCAGQLRATPWKVIDPTGLEHFATKAMEKQEKVNVAKAKSEEPKELGEVNLEPGNNFSHIYGRKPQINRILSALHLAKRTEWQKRTHSVLDGEPGCGKTEIMMSCAKMLGNEGEAWQWFDATSMTKAGVLEQLIEAVVVPPVLFIEEIEKCDESSLRWLLGVMDMRGMIRRTNYRVGHQAKNVRMVVIATANDVNLLKSMMSGALYSRFHNKIYCPRPNRDIMEKILLREMEDIDGKSSWVKATLEFGVDKWGITDPRDLMTICSCGGDSLLTGNFQRDYEETMHPLEKKSLLKNKNKKNTELDNPSTEDEEEEVCVPDSLKKLNTNRWNDTGNHGS